MCASINFHRTLKVRRVYVNKLGGKADCIHLDFLGEGYEDNSTYRQEVLIFTSHGSKVIAELKEQFDKLYAEHCMEEAYAEGMLDE